MCPSDRRKPCGFLEGKEVALNPSLFATSHRMNARRPSDAVDDGGATERFFSRPTAAKERHEHDEAVSASPRDLHPRGPPQQSRAAGIVRAAGSNLLQTSIFVVASDPAVQLAACRYWLHLLHSCWSRHVAPMRRERAELLETLEAEARESALTLQQEAVYQRSDDGNDTADRAIITRRPADGGIQRPRALLAHHDQQWQRRLRRGVQAAMAAWLEFLLMACHDLQQRPSAQGGGGPTPAPQSSPSATDGSPKGGLSCLIDYMQENVVPVTQFRMPNVALWIALIGRLRWADQWWWTGPRQQSTARARWSGADGAITTELTSMLSGRQGASSSVFLDVSPISSMTACFEAFSPEGEGDSRASWQQQTAHRPSPAHPIPLVELERREAAFLARQRMQLGRQASVRVAPVAGQLASTGASMLRHRSCVVFIGSHDAVSEWLDAVQHQLRFIDCSVGGGDDGVANVWFLPPVGSLFGCDVLVRVPPPVVDTAPAEMPRAAVAALLPHLARVLSSCIECWYVDTVSIVVSPTASGQSNAEFASAACWATCAAISKLLHEYGGWRQGGHTVTSTFRPTEGDHHHHVAKSGPTEVATVAYRFNYSLPFSVRLFVKDGVCLQRVERELREEGRAITTVSRGMPPPPG